MKSVWAHFTGTCRRVIFLVASLLIILPLWQDNQDLAWYEAMLSAAIGLSLGWLIFVWIIEPFFAFADRKSAELSRWVDRKIFGIK